MEKILLFCLLSFLMISCKKNPEACFKTSLKSEDGHFYTVDVGREILFTNCTFDGYTYEWRVKDNYNNNSDEPISTEKDFLYTFSKPGYYTVELKAFNKNGKKASSESIQQIEVEKSGYGFDFFLKKFPFRDSNGAFWDSDGTGPDIRARFRKDGSNNWVNVIMPLLADSANINIIENDFNGILYIWSGINSKNSNLNLDSELSWMWNSKGEIELLEFDTNDGSFRIIKSFSVDFSILPVREESYGQKYIVISEGEYEVRLLRSY